MPEIIILSIQYGGYASIIKLIVLIALFLPLFPLLGWVFTDSETLEERTNLWIGIILGTAAAAMIL